MPWQIQIKESVLGDLQWFGKVKARQLLEESLDLLRHDPLAETKKLRTLRPNPISQREVRLRGKYRVLFNVDESQQGHPTSSRGKSW